MSKDDAIAFMQRGYKVRHAYFMPEEFIRMEKGKVVMSSEVSFKAL